MTNKANKIKNIDAGDHARRLVVGITGAIASGKSLVSSIFASFGCDVIDADAVGHSVLTRSELIISLERAFGADILSADGHVDRKVLSAKAFASSESVKKLNSIVHPVMTGEIVRKIELLQANSSPEPIILDAAILFETDWWELCDTTILVDCPEDIRRERVRINRGWDAEELAKREKFQFSLDIRQKKADNVLVNSSSETLLREQVRLLHQKLT